MTESVSFEQVLKANFDRGMAEVYTALPCRITNIPSNLEDARIDVQPIINTYYDDDTAEEHSQILSVPVVFPSSKSSMISFPLFVGDVVLCVFSQASLDVFKQGQHPQPHHLTTVCLIAEMQLPSPASHLSVNL